MKRGLNKKSPATPCSGIPSYPQPGTAPVYFKISPGMKLREKNHTRLQRDNISRENSLAIIDASAFVSVGCPIKKEYPARWMKTGIIKPRA
jgi:hypothetical protein